MFRIRYLIPEQQLTQLLSLYHIIVYQRFQSPTGSIDGGSPGPGAYAGCSSVKSGGSLGFSKREKGINDEQKPGPSSYFEDGKQGPQSTVAYSFV